MIVFTLIRLATLATGHPSHTISDWKNYISWYVKKLIKIQWLLCSLVTDWQLREARHVGQDWSNRSSSLHFYEGVPIECER